MNRTIKQALIAAAGAGILTQATSVIANPTYNNQDLLLGFETIATSPSPHLVGNDLLVDLGPASTYINATAPITISSLTLSDITSPSTGAGQSLNSLSWGVVGDNSTTETLFLSRARANAATQSASWTGQSFFSQQVTAGKIDSIGAGLVLYPSQADSSSAAVQGAGDQQSYGHYMGPNGNLTASWSGNLQQKTGSSFASGSTPSFLDLYEVPTSDSGSSPILLGYFELDPNATLTFVPVPEPTTYGVIAGAGLLGLCLRNQFRRKTA